MSTRNLKVMQITAVTDSSPKLIRRVAAPSSVIFYRIAPYGDDEPVDIIQFYFF